MKDDDISNRYSLRVFHPDGHWKTGISHNQLKSGCNLVAYDRFEVHGGNPLCEVVFWNRIYKMQNGRQPVIPQRIEKWVAGEYQVVKFNPWFFKITNFILTKLPKSIRRYRRNWNYVRFFGM
mgnify:CR=1 FL=1